MKKLLPLLIAALFLFPSPAFTATDADATYTWVEQSDRFRILKVAYTQSGAAGTLDHDFGSDLIDQIDNSFIYLIYVDKTSTDTPELDIITGTTPAIPLVNVDNIDDGWYDKDDFGVGTSIPPVVESLTVQISDAGADTETVTLMIYFYHDAP